MHRQRCYRNFGFPLHRYMVSKQLVDLCGARNSVHILAVIHAKVKTFEVSNLLLSKKVRKVQKVEGTISWCCIDRINSF